MEAPLLFVNKMGRIEIIVVVFSVVLILPAFFYLLTLQNTLKEVDPTRRKVSPGNVWLLFIPLFNLIYPFILYPQISASLKEEYAARELNSYGDFGKGLGITLPILGLASFVPFLGSLASIGGFVIWIIFWAKMYSYKKELLRTSVK